MFKRILVANRGEIAVRIIRACKELGIETVGVYSKADTDSMHIRLCDQSICIGPASPLKSYLNIANIISAATISKSDAIHPGYGFLAENPLFVEEAAKNDIQFIGPDSDVMKLAGNKSMALEFMSENGIPTIPGQNKNIESLRQAIRIARHIGYPVILKAAFGGGGKGMRICSNEKELDSLFAVAKAEAQSAFGNDSIYIEKYLINPRHIEFQILSDNWGKHLCLGSRECSIQRRHQKLIEEAPVKNISKKTLEAMTTYAIRAAKALNYKNVGTIEFLLDEHEQFYFIEINTRIQVEHPVTEMVTGVDLIKEQIKVSNNEKIDPEIKRIVSQKKELNLGGHAIELRVNAEDPSRDFMPSPGKITELFIPGGPGIRVDTFIYKGYTVVPFYDSLLAKLIVWGSSRQEAIDRAKRSIAEFQIEGIKTTLPFHAKIVENVNFGLGNISTSFIEDNF